MTVELTRVENVSGSAVSGGERSTFPLDGEFVELRTDGGVWVSGWLMVGTVGRSMVREGVAPGGAVPVAVLTGGGQFVTAVSAPDGVSCTAAPGGRSLGVSEWNMLERLVSERHDVVSALSERDTARDQAAELRGSAARARDELATEREGFERRIEVMTDAAHEYADNNSLCRVFDEFMESQGLQPRARDYEVEIDAVMRVRVTITRTARDGDDAQENVTSTDVERAVAEKLGTSYYNVDVDDYDVVEVTEA